MQQTRFDERKAVDLASRVGGRGLAQEVEEYFERGARVKPGDVVLDVGANVGAFAAAVAARTGSDVTIHCFEPAVPLFAKLVRSFARVDELAATRHVLHPNAVTSPELHGTERTFYYFKRFPTDSTYDLDRKLDDFSLYFLKHGRELERSAGRWGGPGRLLGRSVRAAVGWFCRPENPLGVWFALLVTGMKARPCQLVSLETVIESRGIERVDLLKVDVEGAELDVLMGCGAAWPLIRSVAIETDERGGRSGDVVALLERNGFEITSCAPPHVASRGDAKQVIIIAERVEGR